LNLTKSLSTNRINILEGVSLSLESGRKMGLIASITAIVSPFFALTVTFALALPIFPFFYFGFSPISSSPEFLIALIAVLIVAVVLVVLQAVTFILAMHRLSRYYGEPEIFNNLKRAILVNVYFFAGFAVYVAALFFLTFLLGLLIPIILAALVAVIMTVVYVRRAFIRLGEKSGIENFKTAGLLYLLGAFIPFAELIGWVFAFIGFKSLKPAENTFSSPFEAMPPPPSIGVSPAT
jgi:uncharacterized membrane protein